MVLALRRGKVLEKITQPAALIRAQDSLLALGNLSVKDQRNAVTTYLDGLRKQRADSLRAAQNAPTIAVADDATNNPATASWYFGNTAQMQTGELEFKRKWGNRPLVDNWRHASQIVGSGGSNTNTTDTAAATSTALDENGFPTAESLLAAIPTTPELQQASRTKIQRAYVDLGGAYMTEMQDYEKASAVLDTLDIHYKTHPYTAEELYRRYQIALKNNKLDEAQSYSNQILRSHGTSKWAGLVRPSSELNGPTLASTGSSIGSYYDETYARLVQRDYLDVLARIDNAREQAEGNSFESKFLVMKAMALAGSKKYDAADTLITNFLQTKPTDSLFDWAQRVKEFITANRPPAPPPPPVTVDSTTTNRLLPAGVPVNTTLKPPKPGSDSTAAAGPKPETGGSTTIASKPPASPTANLTDSSGTITTPPVEPVVAIPTTYSYKPAEEHYFAFSFGKMESRAMGVKAAMTDFNNLKS